MNPNYPMLDNPNLKGDNYHMATRRKQSITDTLKTAIRDSGESLRVIATATGVQRASLIRFLRGDQSLRLDVADKLAEYLGVEATNRGGIRKSGKTQKQ